MKGSFQLLSLVFLVLALQKIHGNQEGPCHEGSEFIVVNQKASFSEATLVCQELKGTLAVPFTSAENDLVINLVSAFPPSDNIWLGKS